MAALDQEVVDLVAPVSGQSIRSTRQLADELYRRAYERINECLNEEYGVQEWPEFRPDHGRFFDFPDAQELREYGFRPPDPTGPETQDPADDVNSPAPTGKAWEDAAEKCSLRQNDDIVSDVRALQNDWLSEALVSSRTRPEESALWRKASECLVDLGYPPTDVVDEEEFLGSVTRAEAELAKTDGQAAADQLQHEMATDYVECAEPVWSARSKDLAARRDKWLSKNLDALNSLTTRIRSTS